MIGQLVKRFLRRVIRGLVTARLAVGLLLVLLVAGGVVLAQGIQAPLPGLSLPNARREPESSEKYLRGNQTFDARLMWSSYSDETIERLRSRGRNVENLQQDLDMARQQGAAFEQINYVGGHWLPDGSSMQFYLVAARGPLTRAELEYVTYIFTLDRAGKITKVQ
jgi:hypothetical protein